MTIRIKLLNPQKSIELELDAVIEPDFAGYLALPITITEYLKLEKSETVVMETNFSGTQYQSVDGKKLYGKDFSGFIAILEINKKREKIPLTIEEKIATPFIGRKVIEDFLNIYYRFPKREFFIFLGVALIGAWWAFGAIENLFFSESPTNMPPPGSDLGLLPGRVYTSFILSLLLAPFGIGLCLYGIYKIFKIIAGYYKGKISRIKC